MKTLTVGESLALMCTAFKDVTDKGGFAYSAHCIRVWQGCLHLNEHEQIAAILHDYVEDIVPKESVKNGDWIGVMNNLNCSSQTIHLLDLLTHRDGVTYEDYIKGISRNVAATEIKKSDLRDNMDPTRLKGATSKDEKRIGKYANAYYYLSKL